MRVKVLCYHFSLYKRIFVSKQKTFVIEENKEMGIYDNIVMSHGDSYLTLITSCLKCGNQRPKILLQSQCNTSRYNQFKKKLMVDF